MRRWLKVLQPVIAGLTPAAVWLGALWALGPSALGLAGAGAASTLAGAGAFHQLARLKFGGAGSGRASSAEVGGMVKTVDPFHLRETARKAA